MRIGIFGGTFDPVHLGHLIIAEEARWQLKLDRVLWLLTPVSPLKTGVEISPWQERWEMLVAAIQDHPGFELSSIDVDRPAPHFAYESAALLRNVHPGDQLVYLIGGDSLRDLPKWGNPEALVTQVDQIGVMQRPGNQIDLDDLEEKVPGIKAKLVWLNSPLIEISGKMIRKRLKAGDPVRHFLPDKVYQIILENQLYLD
jgi:nicotinate-nucleotide adenylyltransferase